MGDKSIDRLTAFPRHVPAGGGGLAQQHARRGARQTRWPFEHAHGARPRRNHEGSSRGKLFQRFANNRFVLRLFGTRRQDGRRPFACKQAVREERIDRRWLHRHRAPVCAKLTAHDLGQLRIDTLAEFGLRQRNGHLAIARDLQPGIEHAFIIRRGKARPILPRPERPADHQAACRQPADQQRTAADATGVIPPRVRSLRVSLSGHRGAEFRSWGNGP